MRETSNPNINSLFRKRGLLSLIAALSVAYFLFFIACAAAQAPTVQETPAEALKHGNYDAAIAGFNKTLAADPKNTEAQAGLLQAYLETGKYTETETTAKKFIAANARNAAALLALGEVQALTGRYAEAIQAFQRAEAASAPEPEKPDNAKDKEKTDEQIAAEEAAASARATTHVRAIVRRGETLNDTGKTDEAKAVFESLEKWYEDSDGPTADQMALVARALIHLDKYQDANDMILSAISDDEECVDAQLTGAEAYTEKYNYEDAAKFIEDALKVNPNSARAFLAIAANKKISGGDDMKKAIDKALEINPNYNDARVLRAYTSLEAEEFDKVAADIDAALKINPNAANARAIRAAQFWLQDRNAEFDNEVKAILAINPRYGMLYETLSHFATNNRRYAQAADFSRRAIELSPNLWAAHSSLGIALIRLGQDAAGREAIETAFKGDPFNVWSKNSLDLMDSMKDYVVTKHGEFVIKTAPQESRAITPFAAELLTEVSQKLAAKYKFSPKTPLTLEIFPNHEDFAVRTLGLPGLGALGVCFGQTMAIDSPSARKPGEFNWGSTLWHEYTHVVTLQITDNRIPRWFSEGLSVYEERRGRPGWGDDWAIQHFKAFFGGNWLKIAELDNGFIRPKSAEQVGLSYFQASQVCEFITDKFGFDAILAMLQGYRDKQKTPQILRAALKLSEDEFDKQFNEYINGKIGKYKQPLETLLKSTPGKKPAKEEVAAALAGAPDDFALNMRAGAAYVEAGEYDKAIPVLKKAIEVFPYYTSGGNPYEMLAQCYEKKNDTDGEAEALLQLARLDENNHVALNRLSAIQQKAIDPLELYRLLVYIQPLTANLHAQGGQAYLDRNDAARAITAFEVALALDPADKATAHYNLGRAYLAAGRRPEAKKQVMKSLEIAPGFDKAQDLLLSLSGK
ncbi:MAG: tetratricopeptide repeat protein [Blastocatellia bacterium]